MCTSPASCKVLRTQAHAAVANTSYVCVPTLRPRTVSYTHLDVYKRQVVEDAAAGIEAAIAGGFDSAAIGDAVNCGKSTYSLSTFCDLLNIVMN